MMVLGRDGRNGVDLDVIVEKEREKWWENLIFFLKDFGFGR